MKQRRQFLRTAFFWGMAPFVFSNTKIKKKPEAVPLPSKLIKGDTVGVIAPASGAFESEDFRFGLDVIRSLGFNIREGKHIFEKNGYLAGSDKNRAADLNRMFADKEVKGIFTLRGGYGTPRILPYVDYNLIKQNPKPIIGYSDITALLNAIYAKTGMVTYHGPIAARNFTPYSLQSFKKVLMEPTPKTIIGETPPFEASEGLVDRENRLMRIAPGIARGRLIGGNLSLMVKLVGTEYEPDYTGKILILEDVGERPYRLDGMLTHLWLAGRLQKLAGVVLGKFTECEATSPGGASLESVFKERFANMGIPVLRGLMFGHILDQATFPVGIEAELNVEAGTLTLQEPSAGI